MTSTTDRSGRRTRGFDLTEYRALLCDFPPRPIQTRAVFDKTMARVDELITQLVRSAAEDMYLALISGLVETWEAEHVQIPPIDGVGMVRALLDDRGMRQRDLVAIFGTDSIVSEVLSGKRELQRKHIERLAAFFHVSPSVFFP